jgi:protein arginine N-methyltransferase 1
VFALEPKDLLADAAARWDALDFRGPIASRRAGRAAWRLRDMTRVFGFALWWECTLAPGIVLSTSPYQPRTHWDQIYLPLLTPISAAPSDEIAITLESDTGGGESGIDVRWTVRHLHDGQPAGDQALSIAAGWLA